LQIGVFDLLVFDEASQMYVEKGLPSILRAKKVIVAGDQKQLRPSSLGTGRITFDEDDLDEDEEIAAALEEESLLDLAKYRYDNTLLNFHYRSQYEELIAFSNYAFYNAQLYVSPNICESEERPIQVHRMENAVWDKRRNMAEAERKKQEEGA
jgi:superfamily I DNA and/or RNA helicase